MENQPSSGTEVPNTEPKTTKIRRRRRNIQPAQPKKYLLRSKDATLTPSTNEIISSVTTKKRTRTSSNNQKATQKIRKRPGRKKKTVVEEDKKVEAKTDEIVPNILNQPSISSSSSPSNPSPPPALPPPPPQLTQKPPNVNEQKDSIKPTKNENLRTFGELLTLSTPFYVPQTLPPIQPVNNTRENESGIVLGKTITESLYPIQLEQNNIAPQMMMERNNFGIRSTVLSAVVPDATKKSSSPKKRTSSSSKSHRHEKKTLAILGLQKEVAELKEMLKMNLRYNGLLAEELMKAKGITNSAAFIELRKICDGREWGCSPTKLVSSTEAVSTQNDFNTNK